MKAINIIGICLAVLLIPLCIYYAEETSYARWQSYDWSWNEFSTPYYGPSAGEVTAMSAGVSLLFVAFFLFQSIMTMTKIKTMTSKVMGIIGISLMGIAFLINLSLLGGAGTYDKGGLINIFVGLIMIGFSIVFLVQTVNYEKKAATSSPEMIDDAGVDEIV